MQAKTVHQDKPHHNKLNDTADARSVLRLKLDPQGKHSSEFK